MTGASHELESRDSNGQTWDIIPDIHGNATKLKTLLLQLGYDDSRGFWHHKHPQRSAIFLGDFIDGGVENSEVISIVRGMLDAGNAQAVMGNHELNAIHFHTLDRSTGTALRSRNSNTIHQHRTFLDEYPVGLKGTDDVIRWMTSLPLFLDLGGFRIVHACWHKQSIAVVKQVCENDRLSSETIELAANKNHPLNDALNVLLKGPHIELPNGWGFQDNNGQFRTKARRVWWESKSNSWHDVVMSIPDVEKQIPNDACDAARFAAYSRSEPPVFVGHYQLRESPKLFSDNVLCLDAVRGKNGPLTSYVHCDGQAILDTRNIQNA